MSRSKRSNLKQEKQFGTEKSGEKHSEQKKTETKNSLEQKSQGKEHGTEKRLERKATRNKIIAWNRKASKKKQAGTENKVCKRGETVKNRLHEKKNKENTEKFLKITLF